MKTVLARLTQLRQAATWLALTVGVVVTTRLARLEKWTEGRRFPKPSVNHVLWAMVIAYAALVGYGALTGGCPMSGGGHPPCMR
jgi:hypothetical protein